MRRGALHVSARKLFNHGLQFRIALSHDLVQIGRTDSGFLKLMVRTAGVNGFVLAHISDAQHTVVLPQTGRNGRSRTARSTAS